MIWLTEVHVLVEERKKQDWCVETEGCELRGRIINTQINLWDKNKEGGYE